MKWPKQAGKKAKPPTAETPGKMDIRTVAQLANVSIATVSRTINRVSTVNPKMAKRVWEAIEKLNYFPNTQARLLVSGRSRLLGLIVSEITNPFFPELIQQGFEDIAVEHGYEILISSTNYDPRRMSLCIRRMLVAQGGRSSGDDLRGRKTAPGTVGRAQGAVGLCRHRSGRDRASACYGSTTTTASVRACSTWLRWGIGT